MNKTLGVREIGRNLRRDATRSGYIFEPITAHVEGWEIVVTCGRWTAESVATANRQIAKYLGEDLLKQHRQSAPKPTAADLVVIHWRMSARWTRDGVDADTALLKVLLVALDVPENVGENPLVDGATGETHWMWVESPAAIGNA